VSTACSASAKAVGHAQRLLATGAIDAALVGGVDALSQTTLRGFHSLQILSPVFCRPFSRERRGINIGEGAAYLLLERQGDAAVHLRGVGESSDAHHVGPDPTGDGARRDGRGARAAACRPTMSTTSTRTVGHALNDLSEGRSERCSYPSPWRRPGLHRSLLAPGRPRRSFDRRRRGRVDRAASARSVDVDLGLNIHRARGHAVPSRAQ
jgi:3-oxoacyl-[acyl-carrier-protein] synthase-1